MNTRQLGQGYVHKQCNIANKHNSSNNSNHNSNETRPRLPQHNEQQSLSKATEHRIVLIVQPAALYTQSPSFGLSDCHGRPDPATHTAFATELSKIRWFVKFILCKHFPNLCPNDLHLIRLSN